jgi:hypothetical protein
MPRPGRAALRLSDCQEVIARAICATDLPTAGIMLAHFPETMARARARRNRSGRRAHRQNSLSLCTMSYNLALERRRRSGLIIVSTKKIADLKRLIAPKLRVMVVIHLFNTAD